MVLYVWSVYNVMRCISVLYCTVMYVWKCSNAMYGNALCCMVLYPNVLSYNGVECTVMSCELI